MVGLDQKGVQGGQVTLRFEDGTSATADAVVGADGVHSVVRDIIVGPDAPPAERNILGVARKVRASRTNGTRRTTEKHELSAVRQWAKSNGLDVSARGRVATAVIAAYEAR
jgi:2-polyprenyl-6-methoxyphenol hydroxylase-like FAD-dependent oxidoreductase